MPHAYPTEAHQHAAETIVDYFKDRGYVDAVLLTCSCARGMAVPDSCLDIAVLVQPHVAVTEIERVWENFYHSETVFAELKNAGRFAEVHLDLINGQYRTEPRNYTGGPDSFELEIGNHLVYSVPLCERTERFQNLRAAWLPYYNDGLRRERLTLVRDYCINNLDHIPFYLPRGLYFQSFNRFYDAYREFLQAVFIKRRTYPIAYDKWIREQLVDILDLPELYSQLPGLFEIRHFESDEIAGKAARLRELLEIYAALD